MDCSALKNKYFEMKFVIPLIRSGVWGGAALQAGSSWVLFSMGTLRFFIDIFPPAAVWPWD